MTEDQIPDYNLFMMCEHLNENALSVLNNGYYLRNCTQQDLVIWKKFPFDNIAQAQEYDAFMTQYYTETYGANEALFFENTLFVCNKNNEPIATCSTWPAYGKFNTIQWFKTLKEHEGKGIGRALFSFIMQKYKPQDYPIFLHTQPSSFRAIKLYSDFGFKLISNPQIGNRTNHLEQSLPILKTFMPSQNFNDLKVTSAPTSFINILQNQNSIQF